MGETTTISQLEAKVTEATTRRKVATDALVRAWDEQLSEDETDKARANVAAANDELAAAKRAFVREWKRAGMPLAKPW